MVVNNCWNFCTFYLLQKTKISSLVLDFLSKYQIQILVLAIACVFAMNYDVLNFGISSDFFGIVFSTILFIFGGRKTNFKINYILIFLIILFEFISYRLHTKSLHFLSLLLLVCLVYYYFTQKFSFIAFICILLFSSLFNKFFEHLTTEIKQILCNLVYISTKDLFNIDRIEGVNFFVDNVKISIDTACMGLSMFKTGLLTGAVLLTLEEKKQQQFFSIFQIIFFSFIIIFLNIVSNYFRIIILVLMKCTQENVLHHSVGLLCFAIYQVLPMIMLVKFFKSKVLSFKFKEIQIKLHQIILVFAIILITSYEMKNEENNDLLTNLNSKYKIQNGVWVNNEVFKIVTPEKLVYIKTPSHKPLICWTGDGYVITESKEIVIDNQKIWYNVMEKKGVLYHSYWWYECGDKKYTSFVETMFVKLIYNKPIRLINETYIIKPQS
jgi:exosortase N